ncbi:MAG: hypothetical protein ABUS57_00645 [Pseudomonadota bacterium]
MNYSICFLDEGGRTRRTQFSPFHDDVAALAEARAELANTPIVEVWKDDLLLARLFRDQRQSELIQ